MEFLKRHGGEALSFHVPGHKRNLDELPQGLPWDIDVTEVPPFDNLQSPQAVLDECQKSAAEYFGSRASYFLVNGSTAGILSGIRACTRRGDKILMARGCHQSVYHAAELCGLNPVFIDAEAAEPYSFLGSIRPEAVKAAAEKNSDASLAVITSPTYEGIVSDIKSIAGILRDAGVLLLVDAAHGAHLDLREADDFFPAGAIAAGADIVVHSLHKMLPSLTQTAMLHRCTDRVSDSLIRHQLSVFQSSSPSYPLMASIDYCCREMRRRGKQLSEKHADILKAFIEASDKLSFIKPADPRSSKNVYGYDPAKLIIDMSGSSIDGYRLEEILRCEYKIKTELVVRDYLLAATGLYTRESELASLMEALTETDKKYGGRTENRLPQAAAPISGIQHMPFETAIDSIGEFAETDKAAGRISKEYIWQYPPGIPVLTPGQEITRELTAWLKDPLIQSSIHSTEGKIPEEILTVAAEKSGGS